ncbi:MAG: DUF1559 domain-containing protein [Lentisphaeria bacterium]|nr:DUF1559 domain-containing protein [Lentisphaeria bacterium]
MRNFTLIELLVVVAIVALLSGLLLPAASKAKEKARQVQCIAQLRELGLAMLQYSDEWRGRLPPYVTAAPASEHPGTNWGWWSYPYYHDTRLLLCPASNGKEPEATKDGLHKYDGSYAWNYDGTQGNRGPLVTAIRKPSLSYLLCDSGDPCLVYGANTWENLMEELDLDWDSQAEGANRHNGSVNIAFVDGHVGSRDLEEFLAAPCKSNDAPWCIQWEGGALERGVVPFPGR